MRRRIRAESTLDAGGNVVVARIHKGTLVNNIDLPRIVLLGSIRRLPQEPFTDVSSRKSTILVFIHFGGDFHYD